MSKTLFFCKTLFNQISLLAPQTKLLSWHKNNLHNNFAGTFGMKKFHTILKKFWNFCSADSRVHFTSTISHNHRKWYDAQSWGGWKAHASEKYYRFACGKCTVKIRSTVCWQCVIKLYNYVYRTDTFYMTLFLDTSFLECKHISHHPLQIRPHSYQ